MNDGLYVQYGCGWDAPDGWMNFDSSPTLRIERLPIIGGIISAYVKGNAMPFPDNVHYGDIVKGLPVEDESCCCIYCSHVLEHLCLEDFRKALSNTRKLLKSDGIFRFVLPDLAFYVGRYLQAGSPAAALEFMSSTGLGESTRARGMKGFIREFFGNSRHRWMWDYQAIANELHEAGYNRIRRATFGDSTAIKFNQVERDARWHNCLGVECRRV